jgi:cellulose synthase/poly-beta-1,6-N-acetylglucosamine synthase-like glycosyltransferase
MSSHGLAATIFWLSVVLLFHTFVGYGMWITLRTRWHRRPLSNPPQGAPLPEVCAVIIAHNAGPLIAGRLTNLLTSDYPSEKLSVLLVSDGSADDTVACAEALHEPRLEILALPERHGKSTGLNAALSRGTSEIVVFTDARQRFAPDAIARLAAHFADPKIGAVSGALAVASAASATGAGIDAYWRYEKILRAAESRLDSCIGCTGAIYAIRRLLFTPIPEDTLLDDVVIPMQIALQGWRVIHDPAAHAFDPQPLEPAAEQRRKQRTTAGNFQMLFRYPQWLLPWHHRLWFQLISHKYLRLAAPLFLLSAFGSSLRLSHRTFYAACLAAQVFFFFTAVLGLVLGKRGGRFFALPAGFVFLNFTTLRGLFYFLTRRGQGGWS